MNICVVGQGYVGLPISIHAAKAGYKVYAFDTDISKVKNLISGITTSPEVTKNELLSLQEQGKLEFISQLESNLSISIFVIAVPTPLKENHEPDLGHLKKACEYVSKYADSDSLIINESTSYIGTLRNFIFPLFQLNSNAKNLKFAVAPERIDPGNRKWHIQNTPRIVSGLSTDALNEASLFYSSFCSDIYKVDKPEIAEAAKLIENTFRQVNIALVNELSEIAKKYKFSLTDAIMAASTKPFGYMPFYPSIGVGGHCIPVDPSYLSYSAKIVGLESKFIDLANAINLDMPAVVSSRIEEQLNFNFKGKLVQIAGISYKSEISDLRESPALELIRILESKGAKVIYNDPFVSHYKNLVSEPLRSDIDLGLIVTPHTVIDFNIWKNTGVKVLDLSGNSEHYGWPKFL